jgi:hypothetical protein
VDIRVTDPQADSAKGFYTYLISGSDDVGAFEIRRRYNDFFYLRESLVKIWPALYVPPIPEKKIAVYHFLNRAIRMQRISKSVRSFSTTSSSESARSSIFINPLPRRNS